MAYAELPVSVQTVYADLVERAWQGDLKALTARGGTVYAREQRGRKYWYWRPPGGQAAGPRPPAKYLGVDSPELRKRISALKEEVATRKERRDMVRSLQAARLLSPDPRSAAVIAAMAEAGVFRLRATLVGTVAFQCYQPMLGVRFPSHLGQTGDVDVAQFHSVSIAVEDAVPEDMESILKSVDERFEAVLDPMDSRNVMRYTVREGKQETFSVDILCPLRGPDRGKVTQLQALGAGAQLIRYLDYLIYQELNAVVLAGSGLPVNVPRPERYALHKLIVSQMRSQHKRSQEKSRKDLGQAAALIEVLAEHRPGDLVDSWYELRDRGPNWRRLADRALLASPESRVLIENAVAHIKKTDAPYADGQPTRNIKIQWPDEPGEEDEHGFEGP